MPEIPRRWSPGSGETQRPASCGKWQSSIPPVIAATSDIAVMRFHGHNADEWESGSVQRRFAYLYSENELKKWVPIEKLASDSKETHILMNNCYRERATERKGAC